ncbi:lipoprotein N-acyltransferase Lnb domain-containing protein [Cognatilysobacter tabacisoli]|uniref:lipoprotein N-acyltransferase Lnb domain-containing protein n=1 Tax=Cognatilysobacter tabacisoli TaxID=2315424 RepID=UPI000E6B4662
MPDAAPAVRRQRRGLRWLLAVACLLFATVASAAPRIGVATMQPGEIFWERFGHNAIVVVDEETGAATSYNFGFFDPGEPDFVSRFVRGDMRYRLVALPLEQDLAYYRDTGRGVTMQWLALPADEARELAAALAENARPENAQYRYDYFLDNCSTRVRDALDRALGGALRRQTEGRSQGSTFRSEAVRLASPAPWMALGFDFGLGPAADVPQPLWAESFVPMRLATALREARDRQGQPVVVDEQALLPHRLGPEPDDAPRQWPLWALWGAAIGTALAFAGARRPRLVASLALPFWTLCGVLGALMLFLWFGTEHRFAWANHNLWLASPLAWALLPGGWRIARGRAAGRVFHVLLGTVAVLALLGMFAHWLPVLPQRNAHWIALLVPIHAGIWTALRRR